MTGPLVTIGETLAVLRSDRPGPLERDQTMQLSIAGSESNVAIGVHRLGHPAVLFGRVGADPLGAMVRSSLQGTGLTPHLTVDPVRPTGLMLVERRLHDVRRVFYYRRDSAGSALTPEEIEPTTLGRAGLLHVTGITPMLSTGAAAAVATAVSQARAARVPVSLDLNYRAALASPVRFREQVGPLLAQADIAFASLAEARLVLEESEGCTPEELGRALLGCGAGEVVLTDGRNGAWGVAGARIHRQPALSVPAVDPLGAGDAFVAGYLSARLDDRPIEQRLATAAQVAAICVSTCGDWQGLPSADDLGLLASEHGAVHR